MIERPPVIENYNDSALLMIALQKDGEFKTIQNDYLYWDKVKYKSKKHDPKLLWSAVKLYRTLNSKRVGFGHHRFRYVVSDYMQSALHQFDRHIGGALSSNLGIAETDKARYAVSSIIEEAISSSQIEGASTTRKRAKEMIQKGRKPKNKSELMIMNNFITMEHIVRHKDKALDVENILFIHELITKRTLDSSADEGCFRKGDDVHVVNHVNGEIVYTPPLRKELKKLMDDVVQFFNAETEDFIHPIIKGCIIHFMIAWIHPFADGNGRAARALFYWYMLKKGYGLTEHLSISSIIKGTKHQYEKSFLYAEHDDNDMTYFLTYHIKTMEKAFEALRKYISHQQKEVFQAARFMKIPDVNERMAQILTIINDDPDRIFSTKEMESRFNVSGFTARTDLKTLVNLGFLATIQVNKKKQNFIKAKGFDTTLKKYDL